MIEVGSMDRNDRLKRWPQSGIVNMDVRTTERIDEACVRLRPRPQSGIVKIDMMIVDSI